MSRAAWFLAGAGAGVYALTRARRAAEALTPDGLADRLAGLSLGLRLFGDEVRTGMAEKENDVRERLGVAFPVNPPHDPQGDRPSQRHRRPDGSAALAAQPAGRPTRREGND